jgi:hypothetical protein
MSIVSIFCIIAALAIVAILGITAVNQGWSKELLFQITSYSLVVAVCLFSTFNLIIVVFAQADFIKFADFNSNLLNVILTLVINYGLISLLLYYLTVRKSWIALVLILIFGLLPRVASDLIRPPSLKKSVVSLDEPSA